MAHKRYIWKNGKRYGPYTYHSYRDEEGVVRKKYLGKQITMGRRGLFHVSFLFLLMVFALWMMIKVFLEFVL